MNNFVFYSVALLCVMLSLSLRPTLGSKLAIIVGLLRFGWLIPIVLSFSPKTISELLPRNFSSNPINILLDDSDSMNTTTNASGKRLNSAADDIISTIQTDCQNKGCRAKIVKLSELSSDTKRGLTPLSFVLDSWLKRVGSGPWVIVSDGADSSPELLRRILNSSGNPTSNQEQGLVLALGQPKTPGYYIEQLHSVKFAFEGKPIELLVDVGRVSFDKQNSVQIQASVNNSVVATSTLRFEEGLQSSSTKLIVPSLKRGNHLVRVRVLPVPDETDLWDNELVSSIEVMPNTVGVLHLLGAPSWDGRFLRRYLKAEPKFDLISFYILRDRWDTQDVSEREMSLIAFPVERLFKEELPNFKVIVLQNFAMHLFMDIEYQKNLVNFVKEGGGILFLGGPRALSSNDLSRSPLAEILPFKPLLAQNGLRDEPLNFDLDKLDEQGSTFDKSAKFTIDFAQPTETQRSMASIFEAWQPFEEQLRSIESLSGLHRVKQSDDTKIEYTPLLNAVLDSKEQVPLAVASYPGKGRAIWILTDSLWQSAMSIDPNRSRFDYNSFFDEAMIWLSRGERKPLLSISEFDITVDGSKESSWSSRVVGPAAKLLSQSAVSWSLTICNERVDASRVNLRHQHGDVWMMEGNLKSVVDASSTCNLNLITDSPLFGNINLERSARIHRKILDKDMSPSRQNLSLLAKNNQARFLIDDSTTQAKVSEWLSQHVNPDLVPQPERHRTSRDFYWAGSQWWILASLLCLILEVIVRRWRLLFGN
jgi:hypothetical protein